MNYLTISLNGGLGNQLFEIFVVISLSLKYKIPFKFIYSDILTIGLHRPTYWNNFLKSIKVFTDSNLNTNKYLIFREPYFHYHKIELDNLEIVKNNGLKLYGYFQSYKYFEENYNSIIKLIKLDENMNNIKNKYSNYFKDIDSIYISMHFRLGDYKKLQQYHPIMNYNYYKKSLDIILKENNNNIINVLYFCEKEDNQYVIETYINPLKTYYNNNSMSINFIKVDDNIVDWEQLLLMCNCTHNIIANSSFSWWGAYFNQNSNKIVCYPSIWFGVNYNNYNTKDLCPNNWIKVES